MANPGVGNKFVSVNLNKSYGQSNHQNPHGHASFGQNRGRGGGAGGGAGGGGGGGMVVLSRPRSSQKPGPKLSVPPPLNLPSLRKEHEKFDSLGSVGGPSGGGVPGGGARPSSSGMGWTKPGGVVALQEKGGFGSDLGGESSEPGLSGGAGGDGVVKGTSGVYMPPSARLGVVVGSSASAAAVAVLPEHAPVLRGEDFPTLQAALPSISVASQKQKDGSSQKQKQVVVDETVSEPRNSSHLNGLVNMRPQSHSSRDDLSNGQRENGGKIIVGVSQAMEQVRKQDEYFPDPLPIVRLNHRLDWADDERDTSFGLGERGRDYGFPRSEAYWDRDFDMPRVNVLPHKPVQNTSDRWGQRGDDVAGKVGPRSGEVPKRDSHSRDGRTPSREGQEGNVWKTSTLPKDGPSVSEDGSRLSSVNREIHTQNNKYTSSPFRENDFGRREVGYGLAGKQPWNNTKDSYGSRGFDWNTRDRHGNEKQHNRYRDGALQNNSMFKLSNSMNGRGMPLNDPILIFGKEKRHFSKTEKPYVEDPFMKDFGATDLFTGGLLGVVKRKKDVPKQTEIHDPVRESFEAELERVQKMQEQERQRAVEEQERALEMARREEEERARAIREQEDRQRKMEEDAREAAWRAEQERLEAMKRAEEQRIAREEERRRIFTEEERRKQAAKQKLLELEEKMAKRQSEQTDDQLSLTVKEKEASRAAEVGDWEEGERMVEQITTSASSDSSSLNRPFEMGSRSQSSRDSPAFFNRGKPNNSWRRESYDNGNSSTLQYPDQEIGHHSPRRDASGSGRTYSRKEFFGGPGGSMPPRSYHKGSSEPPLIDDFNHLKGQRWNLSGDGDHYGRNQEIGPEINDQLVGDVGWGQGRSRGNSYSQYQEPLYSNSEADGSYSYGRSRYSVRQPRVLPPPIASMHKSSYRSEVEPPGPSTYLDIGMEYNHGRNESTTQNAYDGTHRENVGQPEIINGQQENEQKGDGKSTPRCDSQSSLSVSSPPSSPTHLSHEDLDESGESSVLSGERDSKDVSVLGQGNEEVELPSNVNKEAMMTDTVEDEEWAVASSEQLQEQEEYDEDEDGYEEEDEAREVDDDLHREFNDMRLDEKELSDMTDNLVLGFNEGVEVGMPSDDNNESSFTVPQPPNTIDAICGDLEALEVNIVGSSRMFPESDNEVIQQSNTPRLTPESELLDHRDLAPHSSVLTVVSSAPAVLNQAEAPIKLQFGLFSGPSLIPSPLPAIQIGSIQMPLHLHPQVGTSLSHMHPPQPLFQFGQLRYASSISQGMMPLPPQPMPYVQPNVPPSFPFNQNPVGPPPATSGQDPPHLLPKNNVEVLSADDKVGIASRNDVSQVNTKEDNSSLSREKTEIPVIVQREQAAGERHSDSIVKNYTAFSHPVIRERNIGGPKVQASSSRGKRFVFAVKNSGSRPYPAPESNRYESSGYQRRSRRNVPRTEFRVREGADKRQSAGLVSSNDLGFDENPNVSEKGMGVSARAGHRRVVLSHKAPKQTLQPGISSSVPVSSRETDSAGKAEKGPVKDSAIKVHAVTQSGEAKHKRNFCEEDVDAPLQSGIVRIFEQPGIEAPSDEDDFIEVRSKRQMLNDRREQREKEIKAKSRISKVPRRSRSTSKVTNSVNLGRVYGVSGGEASNTHSDCVAAEGRRLAVAELSTGFHPTAVSQPLAPIGTPAVKSDSQTTRSVQTSSNTIVTGSVKHLGQGSAFDSKTKALDDVQAWGNSRINQQVMALTQTQLEDAMKPGQFDSRASAGNHTGAVNDSNVASSSLLTKDKPFSSTASPVNSLLAGEKIQFGAVTSPTILPPSNHVVSHGIGPPGPSQLSHNLSEADNECDLLFDKEKHTTKSGVHLEDCEAEAEAAASAIAVAAISSDEIVRNGLGTCSVSVSDTKSFGVSGIDGIAADGSNNQRFTARQSRAEESLTVSLPADLSVETPPINMWPPLPSPPNTSSQMLSHFPGGPHSHFPFYEMNPMMGSPVFAFGPHDESASTAQKSAVPSSASLGPWQQCHSGVDSFYGPPAGFTGPFITPPGGIPGVQGPPHMFVYNHFAPVGQFGQVGLSFMGTTYIPSGKQPDWKHNPGSSPMIPGDGEMNNLNMVPGQRNPATIPAPIQHLAPGSPLLPMPSMAMFDVSPFQSSPDMSVQARWSHVPVSSIQSVPMSMPLQQQTDVHPSKLSHAATVDKSMTPNRYPESRNSSPSDQYPATATQLPDELGLANPSGNTSNGSPIGMISEKAQNGSNGVSVQATTSNIKTQPSQHNANFSSQQQHGGSSGYGYHRGGGGAPHRNNSGPEWNHRRTGFQGRNSSLGGEKSYHSSKMKQIYVAKQTTTAGPRSTTS